MKLLVQAMQLSLNCLVFKFVDGYLAVLVFVKYLKKKKVVFITSCNYDDDYFEENYPEIIRLYRSQILTKNFYCKIVGSRFSS